MTLEELIKPNDTVSSKSSILFKLIRALRDPVNSFKDFAEIVEGDTALSARLLKMVNSSFYGFEAKIETIDHALTVVGMEQLYDLVIATAVQDKFKGVPKNLFNMDFFWRHSIACGLTARIIAKEKNEPDVNRFYLKGMLHDIGRLIFYMKIPELAKDALLQSKSNGEYLYKVERELFGFDHAEAGGALFRSWEFPESIVEAVTFHHRPGEAKQFFNEASIVHVAEFVASSTYLADSGEPLVPSLDGKAWEKLGLPLKTLSFLVEQLDRQLTEKIQLLTS